MLFAGKPWDAGIKSEIGHSLAAIILVSPYLLNSNYVRDHEIPAFLALAESSELPVYCLYVEHSVVDEVQFRFEVDGSPRAKRLTDYQGLNRPDCPISQVPRREHNKVLADAAKRIYGDLRSRFVIAFRERRTIKGVIERPPRQGTKTLYVAVERMTSHPKYKKRIRKAKTYVVHWNENFKLKEGDHVEIAECRPMSKTKHHKLIRKITN
jgi:small subunit ribosomal protein S17